MNPGKDGKPFCPARYVGWVFNGPSRLQFNYEQQEKSRPKAKRIWWVCPKCLTRFPGKNAKHLRTCGGTMDRQIVIRSA